MGTEATMNIMEITTTITTTIMVEDTIDTDKVAMACTTNTNKKCVLRKFYHRCYLFISYAHILNY